MVTSLLFDFGITSLLLFAAYLLRTKVKIFQRLFLPAPLIAGILGILLGPHVLGTFSPVCLRYSEFIGQVSLPLLSCVFCTQLFMMKLTAAEVRKAFHSFALMSIVVLVQVLIGIALVRAFMPGQNDAYGLLPMTSFLGGPGVCTIVTNIVGDLDNFSIETANSIGNTYATVSMLTGVTIGMVLINVARRKGILMQSGDLNKISQEEFTGYVPPELRQPIGQDVTGGNSANSMTLQFAISGLIIFFGILLQKLLAYIPALRSFAITITILLMGLPIGILFQKCKWDRFVDPKSLKHFSSIALEYLIATTIANTNIRIFATHGKLLLITSVIVILVNIVMIFGLGKLWNKEHWFENTIGVFGVANGVAATGLLLLRMSDPNDETGSLSPYCTAVALLASSTQMIYLMFIPMLISSFGNQVVLGTAAALAGFLVLGFLFAGKKR